MLWLKFDPQKVTYRQLCDLFFRFRVALVASLGALIRIRFHDPTTLNRQGNDVGTQYRSVIFYYTDQQKQVGFGAVCSACMICREGRPRSEMRRTDQMVRSNSHSHRTCWPVLESRFVESARICVVTHLLRKRISTRTIWKSTQAAIAITNCDGDCQGLLLTNVPTKP